MALQVRLQAALDHHESLANERIRASDEEIAKLREDLEVRFLVASSGLAFQTYPSAEQVERAVRSKLEAASEDLDALVTELGDELAEIQVDARSSAPAEPGSPPSQKRACIAAVAQASKVQLQRDLDTMSAANEDKARRLSMLQALEKVWTEQTCFLAASAWECFRAPHNPHWSLSAQEHVEVQQHLEAESARSSSLDVTLAAASEVCPAQQARWTLALRTHRVSHGPRESPEPPAYDAGAKRAPMSRTSEACLQHALSSRLLHCITYIYIYIMYKR